MLPNNKKKIPRQLCILTNLISSTSNNLYYHIWKLISLKSKDKQHKHQDQLKKEEKENTDLPDPPNFLIPFLLFISRCRSEFLPRSSRSARFRWTHFYDVMTIVVCVLRLVAIAAIDQIVIWTVWPILAIRVLFLFFKLGLCKFHRFSLYIFEICSCNFLCDSMNTHLVFSIETYAICSLTRDYYIFPSSFGRDIYYLFSFTRNSYQPSTLFRF